MKKFGVLHLFPCPIAEGIIDVIPLSVVQHIQKIDFFIAEKAKTTRKFLKDINHPVEMANIEIFELDKKNPLLYKEDWLKELLAGRDIGLFSEAGTPCIADPGEKIVAIAHQSSIVVKPYVGPNSILLALMASGLNGEQFHFHTYLPIHQNELSNSLKNIVLDIQKHGTSHIFIETPYRNMKTFETIMKSIPKNLFLCVATDITSDKETIITKSIAQWHNIRNLDLHKKPSIFILGMIQN